MHAAKCHLPELGAAAGQDAQQTLPGTCTVPLGQRGCCLCPLRGDKPADRMALRAEVAEKPRAVLLAPCPLPCAAVQKGEGRWVGREKNHEMGMSKKGNSTRQDAAARRQGEEVSPASSQPGEKG